MGVVGNSMSSEELNIEHRLTNADFRSLFKKSLVIKCSKDAESLIFFALKGR